MPKCQTTQERAFGCSKKVVKQIAIQASRGGGNVNQIINQRWTQIINNNSKSEFTI